MEFMGQPTEFETKLRLSTGIDPTALKNHGLIKKAYDDQVAGDQTAFFKLLDPDVEFVEAAGLPYGARVTGIDDTIRAVHKMLESWSRMSVEIYDYAASGDIVIAYMHLRAVSRVTGRTYDNPLAEMFRFRDGKIIEWRPFYFDTYAVRQACGLA